MILGLREMEQPIPSCSEREPVDISWVVLQTWKLLKKVLHQAGAEHPPNRNPAKLHEDLICKGNLLHIEFCLHVLGHSKAHALYVL